MVETIPIKGKNDNREYLHFELENKLKVLLVSDNEADREGASMSVNVGYYQDPDDISGLAHFLEHMLFLGSEKYPDEDYFGEIVKDCGGDTNAYTGAEETNYYFEINEGRLYDVLDVFSGFFTCPLFTQSATDRELKAINNEHEKNLNNDDWRLLQLIKSNASTNHPFSKFGTGSRETLETIPKEENIDVRAALLDFHKKYYSANIMYLCVYTKKSISEAKSMVESLFSDVKNKDVSIDSKFDALPLQNQTGKIYHVIPIRDVKHLSIYFPMPLDKFEYKRKPLEILSEIIGHEGEGTLCEFLRKKHWVDDIVVGQYLALRDSHSTCFFFQISMTKEGLSHTDEIIQHVFQYINLLQSSNVPKYFYEEAQGLADVKFHFTEKNRPFQFCPTASNAMAEYPPEHVLSGPRTFWEYDEQLLRDRLFRLNPENAVYIVSHRDFETDKTEKWYGTKYSLGEVDPSRLKKWKNAKPDSYFVLPKPNPFIPKDLSVLPKGSSEIPTLVFDESHYQLYFKQDDRFQLPKLNMFFDFEIPSTNFTAQNYLIGAIFVKLIEEQLQKQSYHAHIAGVNYTILHGRRGFQVLLYGWSDQLQNLALTVFDTIFNSEPDCKMFLKVFETVVRDYGNMPLGPPYQQCFHCQNCCFRSISYHYSDLLQVSKQVDFEKFKIASKLWLSSFRCKALIHGNITKDQAISNLKQLMKFSSDCHVPLGIEKSRLSIASLEENSDYCYKFKAENPNEDNGCTLVTVQIGLRTKLNDAFAALYVQMVSNRFSDTLRTKEQLGYIVANQLQEEHNCSHIFFLVQGSEKPPNHVRGRIDEFLKNTQEVYLQELTTESFQDAVSTLISKTIQSDKKLRDQSLRFWDEIVKEQFRFNRRKEIVEVLKTATLPQFLEWTKVLSPEKGNGRLVVEMWSQKQLDQSEDAIPSLGRSVVELKSLFQLGLESNHFPAFSKF